VTCAKSGLFWSQCFLPSHVIRKAQAGAGKSSLGFCGVSRLLTQWHRIKISNRRATQRCNVSAFFYAKICSLLARRRSSQPVQRVYWPENVIDWLGRWRPTCVMRHARGQKLQSFRRKWPFYMDLYSMAVASFNRVAIYGLPEGLAGTFRARRLEIL
jgi:hypothetical protein